MFLFQSEIILLLNVYINRALSEVEGGWRKTFFFRKFCLSPVKKCVVPWVGIRNRYRFPWSPPQKKSVWICGQREGQLLFLSVYGKNPKRLVRQELSKLRYLPSKSVPAPGKLPRWLPSLSVLPDQPRGGSLPWDRGSRKFAEPGQKKKNSFWRVPAGGGAPLLSQPLMTLSTYNSPLPGEGFFFFPRVSSWP